MTVWIGVFLIGGLGAVCRLLVDRAVLTQVGGIFPAGILVVNVTGAFLLGLLGTLALSPHTALLAGTAFVGAYTTFSTWMLDTIRLAEERRRRYAVLNIMGSIALGLVAVWLGQIVGRL